MNFGCIVFFVSSQIEVAFRVQRRIVVPVSCSSMGFVGNYAPSGLSPQMYDMPVIQYKKSSGLSS